MKLGDSLRALDLAFRIYHYLKHHLAFTTPLPQQFRRLTANPAVLQLFGA
jgi:hypothetical protein